MKIEGTYIFDATLERVWTRLLEPDALAGCIPGCREFRAVGGDQYEVTLKVGMGTISGTYRGKVTVSDRDEPKSFRMIVEGKGSGGSIKGDCILSLRESKGATEVTLAGDAQVSGMIARVGQRLLSSASEMMVNQFFACMKAKVEQR